VDETGSPHGYPPFEEFFTTEYPRLVRLVMSVGATLFQAEEAAQEAMLQALRNWPRLINPAAWSRKAALHEHYKAMARAKREFELRDKAVRTGSLVDRPTEDVYESAEFQSALQAMRRLPRAQREVIALSYDGYAPTEIAAILEKTPEAVRSNLREARKRLASELTELPVGESDGKEGV
jgi:RNA polymerase sigma factor (sigma-70 family)